MPLRAILKQTLQTHRRSPNLLVRYAIEFIYFLRACWRFASDPRSRSIMWLTWFRAEHLHQTTVLTGMDRYPKLFSACRDHFAGMADLRILSFGCSSGEEVLTLRQYFPSAHIVGTEINPRNLALCRKLKVDARIAFVRSERATLAKHGPFDLIFCMAVLQRTPQTIDSQGITSLKEIYPFEKFDRQIVELDSCLNRDGALVIQHSQYFFKDSSVASQYVELELSEPEPPISSMFDRDSTLVENATGCGTIFIKTRG